MPEFKEKDLEKVLKGLMSIFELREVLKKQSEACEECEEEDDEDEDLEEMRQEEELVQKYCDEYESMFMWAFGKAGLSMEKEKVSKRWAVRHPDLPALFMPVKVSNDVSNMILMMQVLPHWNDFQRQNKKD